ncbi:fibronectin type III domain-containing protein [Nocardiopsis ganjiahuensis]|uniref:fibronectin type III domain-containing protein n=1 Tax=Nocardiopsis ganjiahuensis TaxID=239984 RepID=UPI00034DFC65|nr:fibronectin type III domain-containing protein [Nocardiopsis ganjiahuensis]
MAWNQQAHNRYEQRAQGGAPYSGVPTDPARRGRADWEGTVRDLTTGVLDRAALADLLHGAGVPEEEAVADLRAHGVRVVDRLPDLPSVPPVREARALSEHLRTRGAAFSPAVVFGERRLAEGFTVLDGFRLRDEGSAETTLSDAALDAAERRVQVEAMTESRAAAERVLAVLRAARSPALRDRIVLWEILEHLGSRPAALTERALVQPWVDRGLDRDEAALIAAAVRREGHGGDRSARAEREVRDLLADHQLRQARAAAADLPDGHGLRTRVAELADQVAELVGTADTALRGGRKEEAALALESAVELAADDEDLAARLAAVEPEPPRGVAARVDGRRVVVTWQPSSSRAGRVTYRVIRRTGHGGTARERPVGEVSGTQVVDDGLPVGNEASYAVVAVRGGLGASASVASQPVMITPDVTDLRVWSDEASVSGSWRAPAEAVRVEVLRAEGGPPRGLGDGVPVEHDGTGFVDTSVRPDEEYHYRVRAVYVTSRGRARSSSGLVLRARPGPAPAPVRDLAVAAGGTGLVASWSAPPRGRVVLFTSELPPSWAPGRTVPADRWAELGSEVSTETVVGADGRCRAVLPLPAGTTHVLAVTVAGDRAVAGGSSRVVAAPPVTGLRAERFDTVVRLSWTWPEHAATAVVSWWDARRCPGGAGGMDGAGGVNGTDGPRGAHGPGDPGGGGGAGGVSGARGAGDPGGAAGVSGVSGPAAGTERESRLRYEAEGGFEAHMGSGPVVVTVRTAVPTGAGESLSPPATVRVPDKAVLEYRVEAVGLLRRERVVHLSTRDACAMPEVAVVYTPGRVQPHSGEQGRVLATFPARHLSAGERVSVRVQPPREPGPAWLMCFPMNGGAGVRLRQPPVKELRL